MVPGGPAAGSVVQGKLLIQAGQPPAAVASALTAVGLLTTGVLLLLPILTVPALIIGPPPARQLQLGLLVSVMLAVLIVGLGVTVLTWRGVLERVGRAVGYAIHVVRRAVSPQSVATSLVAQRDRVATAFEGHWWRAVFASAANRMFDYAALVAALVAFGAHARPSEVLLAYVVAQALALIPITPGGLGFVESGLTTLLVLIGISADTALIATLMYRLVSFWLRSPSEPRRGQAGTFTAPLGPTRPGRLGHESAGQDAEEARRPRSHCHSAVTMTAPTREPTIPLSRSSSPSPESRLTSNPPAREPRRPRRTPWPVDPDADRPSSICSRHQSACRRG